MRMIIIFGGLIVCAGIQSPGAPAETNDFQTRHPLSQYSPEAVRAGKVPGKRLNYLRKYAAAQLKANGDAVIKSVKSKSGDFGLPEKLPADSKLLAFLSKSADHFRVPYLHLGKTPDRRNLAFLYVAGALRDLWIYYGDENARLKYIAIMKYAVRNIDKMSDKQISDKIDESGTGNFWHPLMKSAAYYYARLYEATGDEYYAKRTCLILERFGEVIGKWKIHYWRQSGGKTISGEYKLDHTPDKSESHYGLWGWWGNVHDLMHSKPLLDAYTLVKSSGTFKQLPENKQKIIVDGLLNTIVKKHLYYPMEPLHNQNMNRISGMIYFGRYLNKPEYIRIAMSWLSDIIHLGYRRDGFWCEGSVSYGFSITRGLLSAYSELKDYEKQKNADFDKSNDISYNFGMIKAAFNKLALPDGRSIALDDSTWDTKKQFFGILPKKVEPFLMGASQIGMMGFGSNKDQVRLYLHWDDSAGHEHLDMLGMALWANNQEICSETAYRGLQEWNRSTAAHNIVMIDEKDQPGMQNYRTRKKADEKIYLHPKYTYRDLWRGYRSRYDDGGIMQLWDTTETDVQVAEIDGSPAFSVKDGISQYSRSLLLVKTGEKSFYIVDIFRVAGGLKHDWMLHGNLSKRYTVKVLSEDGKPLVLERRPGQIGKYLKNLRSTKQLSSNVILEFDMKDGNTLRSTICGAPDTEIVLAEGPAMRLGKEPACWGRPGYSSVKDKSKFTSEFVAVRRKGPENIFVAVHEAFTGSPAVKKVELSQHGNDLNIKVTTRNAKYTIDADKALIKFSGNGKKMVFGNRKITGDILEIASMDRGAKENSFTVSGSLQGQVNPGELFIVIDGDGRRHPYIIKKIVSENDKSKVLTLGETGMIVKDNLMIMTYFPSWDIPGKLTYLIPGKQISRNVQ